MGARKVAVVTGSNKGVGFGIVRGLCQKFHGDVYLTSRDERRGRDAVRELEKEGLSPKFHQLDVTDKRSIYTIKNFLEKTYGGLDILVNNAGIMKSFHTKEEGNKVIETNYVSVVNISEALFPLLRPNARVVNVSSRMGNFTAFNMKEETKMKFASQNLTVKELTSLVWEYYNLFDCPNFDPNLYIGQFAYGVSKLGLNRLTSILQRDMSADQRQILVNSCCPGYVDTDMSDHKGLLTVDQGADTPVYLALLPADEKSIAGEMVCERVVVKWDQRDLHPNPLIKSMMPSLKSLL
ncbi:carbonyl reductase [NADPH] 3-like [Mytilus galloprovincialis]|uniref:carbonyl reductase [NADPH] 3-like n=1 Tax=Mytilus edulis TaxID=6550 RepID=UPI0039F0330F